MQAQGVVRVFKRGRARKAGKGEAVCVTLELLQELGSLPLPTAAETLGISATALKGACRKLGIERWPYWVPRGPAPASQGRHTHTKDASTQTDINSTAVYACDVPVLVDAEAAFDVHAWWN